MNIFEFDNNLVIKVQSCTTLLPNWTPFSGLEVTT